MVIENGILRRVENSDIVNGTIEIPKSVTSIGEFAFAECKGLKSIKIPKGVMWIEKGAFENCENLESVEIPEGVTNIDGWAFQACISLINIVLPNSLTKIGDSTFYGCKSLKSIEIPDSVTSIGEWTFQGCISLEKAILPNSLTMISNSMFKSCTSLTSIRIPDSVTSISQEAFLNCRSLKSIEIPNSVKTLGEAVFFGCTNLESAVLSEGITSIENHSFYECTSLKSIEIPDGVESLGGVVFYGCTSLQSVVLPNSLSSVGARAFRRCISLQSIELPNSVKLLENAAFDGCTSLESIVIPDSIKYIGNETFLDCTSLKSVEIPNSVEMIGSGAFRRCTSLKNVIIPDSVTTIFSSTFAHCKSLISVNIPGSVLSIDEVAFACCESLESVIIPDGVKKIGYKAFSGCTELTSVTLTDSIKSVGPDAFAKCPKLKNITIPDEIDIEDLLLLYSKLNSEEKQLIDESLIFGDESGRLAEIRKKGQFKLSKDYSNEFMNLLYYKIFSSVGMDTLERMIRIPEIIHEEDIELYGLEDNEKYKELYDEREKIKGNFATTVKELQAMMSLTARLRDYTVAYFKKNQLQGGVYNNKFIEDSKDSSQSKDISTEDFKDFSQLVLSESNIEYEELDVKYMILSFEQTCRALTQLLESQDIAQIKSFTQLMSKIMERFDIKQIEAQFQISEVGEKLNSEQLRTNIENTRLTISKTLRTADPNTGEIPDENQIESIQKILENVLRKVYRENNTLDVTNLEQLIIAEFSKKRYPPYIKQNASNIASRLMGLFNEDKTSIQLVEKMFWEELLLQIVEVDESLSREQFRINLGKTQPLINEALKSTDPNTEEVLVEDQIEPIQKILEKVLRKIYKENNTIEVENLEQLIIAEFSDEHYSPYIRQNASNIASRFMRLYNNNQVFREDINYNSILSVLNTKNAIQQSGKEQWIRQILGAFRELKNKNGSPKSIVDHNSETLYTDEEIRILSEKIGIQIQTEREARIKDKNDLESAYKMIEAVQESMPEETRIMVTYKQLHDMFGGVHEPYSEKFKAFFEAHIEEFLYNPRCIEKFSTIHNNFDIIINSELLKNKYLNGKLTIDDIFKYLESRTYNNQREGDEEIARYASTIGEIVTDEQFAEVQQVFDIVKKRERTSIPPLYIYEKENRFRGRMLSPNDILTMFVGNITDCCQKFGGVGMGAMLLGAIEENGGIFVVEELQDDGTYHIIAQSLTIRQRGKNGQYDRLTFDNIEMTENVTSRLSEQEQEEILGIYQKAGQQAMELDRQFLTKLLKAGKISPEVFESLVLKEVVAGKGYNKLVSLNRLSEADTVVPAEAFYEYNNRSVWNNKSHPWIDSVIDGVPAGAKKFNPVLIAEIGEEGREEIKKIISDSVAQSEQEEQEEQTEREKLSGVEEWYGKTDGVYEIKEQELTKEQIEIIKRIEKKVYRPAQQVMNNDNVQSKSDISFSYETDNPTVVIGSEKTWYLIYGTTYEGDIAIIDLASEDGINSDKNTESSQDRKASLLSIFEMTDYLYGLLITSAKEGKRITCNATKDTSLINIKNMIKKGLIEAYDEEGRQIFLSDDRQLQYEDGSEVEYRAFEGSDDESIKMLDLEIRPNLEKMIAERKKIQDLLERIKQRKRMVGTKKEEGLDELRRTLRDDISDDVIQDSRDDL